MFPVKLRKMKDRQFYSENKTFSYMIFTSRPKFSGQERKLFTTEIENTKANEPYCLKLLSIVVGYLH